MEAYEEEEDLRDNTLSKSKSLYENSKRFRNMSFVIPRTKSKEVID